VVVYFIVTGGDDGGTAETDPSPSAMGVVHLLQSFVT
jgi:hypothetical protein